ncbi:MAG TPA: GNAT family N-acetyltransferase [Candidatus Dormibacteraeota bacterium]|nr:GNAT family N-acetyltransferase [Candidatus Dormibacteraeota bacterium]
MPEEDDARTHVSTEAQIQAYKHIYSAEELKRFAEGKIEPSWELGNLRYAFVAELDGQIVGLADLTDLDDGWMLVEPIYVLPGRQRSGTGTLLWNRCKDAARYRNASGLRVWALRRNEIANCFYRKQGCQPKYEGELVIDQHHEAAIGYEFAFS